MEKPINSSEEFVYEICRKSFLSFWSYLNPQGKNPGKELCDILVVCDPHIIILSVKDVRFKDTGRPEVDWSRWGREAIEESVRQIIGAQKWLEKVDRVTRKDGTEGLALPPKGKRVYHRIAVAFGGNRRVPMDICREDSSDGQMTHVFDEEALRILMRHLDTITDFTKYLTDKEAFFKRKDDVTGRRIALWLQGGEEDILAAYLSNDRTFPVKGDSFIVAEGLWNDFSQRREFIAKLREDESSYAWDRLIELLAVGPHFEEWEFVGTLSELELTVRTMALEHRFSRRILGMSLEEFIKQADSGKLRSRLTKSMRGVVYVFMMANLNEDNKHRVSELGCRCYAAFAKFPGIKTVVGIDITRRTGTAVKRPTNICHFHSDNWSDEFLAKAKQCQEELGFFKGDLVNRGHRDEYPSVD